MNALIIGASFVFAFVNGSFDGNSFEVSNLLSHSVPNSPFALSIQHELRGKINEEVLRYLRKNRLLSFPFTFKNQSHSSLEQKSHSLNELLGSSHSVPMDEGFQGRQSLGSRVSSNQIFVSIFVSSFQRLTHSIVSIANSFEALSKGPKVRLTTFFLFRIVRELQAIAASLASGSSSGGSEATDPEPDPVPPRIVSRDESDDNLSVSKKEIEPQVADTFETVKDEPQVLDILETDIKNGSNIQDS
ncbi:UNVERIFIED_CONTAM: hypothetical protein RMT77_017439 [Armadillidium vulgare]